MGILSELESTFDEAVVDEFIGHYSVMVETMEPLMVNLERTEHYSSSVDELFRIFHNIKSASGYLKIDAMNRLSALTEDTLEQMREERGPANSEVVDWLLSVHDQLETWNKNINIDEDLSRLHFKLLVVPDIEGDV